METVEHLIVGGGPAGLRAAQVLAQAGREVLLVERHREIGPKTCAGGLTRKTVRLLRASGLPPGQGLRSEGYVTFTGAGPILLDPEETEVITLPRRELGRLQSGWARAAGAEVVAGVSVTGIDLVRRRARVGDRVLRWTHLIGADGADSGVRRALGLPSPRAYFAAEYNVPGLRLTPLRIECAPRHLANGYFWVFPHCDYTSIGAVAPKRLVRPADLRGYLTGRARALGADPSAIPFEGAVLEVEYRGTHFPGGVHLAGDAAGLPSSLTAEGIYPALVSGEEVAQRILDPGFPSPGTRRWLRLKRRHDRLARWLSAAPARRAMLPLLAAVARLPDAGRPLARWFLEA